MALVQPSYGAAPVAASPAAAPATVRVATAAPVSRLVQMQARFQKKQMEEKEQKLLRLYESQQQRAFQRVGRGSAGSSTASLSSSTSTLASLGGGGGGGGAGKVRQLFEERRSNGWDRSYPLDPVAGGKAAARASQPTAYAQQQLPLAVPKTKLTRGASLDRSQGAFQHPTKSVARRSKSHARAEAPAALANGHHQANGNHVNGHHAANGLYDNDRAAAGHRSNKLYHAYEGGSNAYRKTAHDRVDDYNNRNFRRHQDRDDDRDQDEDDDDEEDFPEDEVNYSALGEDTRPSRNQHFAAVSDNKRQEELFAKYQVRELSNRDLLSPPPPELYDEGIDEGTFIYEKVPNVGGPLRSDGQVNNSDRFKTYISSKHNRGQYKEEIVPRAPQAMATKLQDSKKTPALRRESASPPTRSVKPPVKKPEQKAAPGARSGSSRLEASNRPASPNASSTSATKKSAPVSRPTASPNNKHILNNNTNLKATSNAQKVRNGPSAPAPARAAPTRDDLTECPICHRRFTNDRIKVHQEICSKTSQKKRKEYDATKHRVQGTEAEPFVKRTSKPAYIQKKPEVKKGDWRKKHEEFIQTIRAAKEAQAHVAAGGKLSDLPPPPPLDTSDYIQCPHCGRRFNEAAAERHIPRCANMQHNKPKPVGKSPAGLGKRR